MESHLEPSMEKILVHGINLGVQNFHSHLFLNNEHKAIVGITTGSFGFFGVFDFSPILQYDLKQWFPNKNCKLPEKFIIYTTRVV